MDIAPATAGHALVIPREHSAEPARDLRRGPRAHDARRPAAGARGCSETLAARRLQHPQLLRRRRLADGLSLPRPRGPPLRRRPAEAALGARPRATASEIAGDRRSGSGARADGRAHDHARARRAPSPRSCSPTRRSTCSPTTPSTSSMECLDEVEGSDARALVWRAEGEIFTGGVDVNAFQRIVDAESPEAAERHGRPADRGRAAARGARDPDPGADPRALPDRGARGRARLRHHLGRASRRSSGWSRRWSGSRPAPAAPSGWPSGPGPAGRGSSS